MIKVIINFSFSMLLLLSLTDTAHATHDAGQGKSQDGALKSISVAPEPSTFWLFLTGGLALSICRRYQKNHD